MISVGLQLLVSGPASSVIIVRLLKLEDSQRQAVDVSDDVEPPALPPSRKVTWLTARNSFASGLTKSISQTVGLCSFPPASVYGETRIPSVSSLWTRKFSKSASADSSRRTCSTTSSTVEPGSPWLIRSIAPRSRSTRTRSSQRSRSVHSDPAPGATDAPGRCLQPQSASHSSAYCSQSASVSLPGIPNIVPLQPKGRSLSRRGARYQTASSTTFSTSLTRSCPEISFGSSVSRSFANAKVSW